MQSFNLQSLKLGVISSQRKKSQIENIQPKTKSIKSQFPVYESIWQNSGQNFKYKKDNSKTKFILKEQCNQSYKSKSLQFINQKSIQEKKFIISKAKKPKSKYQKIKPKTLPMGVQIPTLQQTQKNYIQFQNKTIFYAVNSTKGLIRPYNEDRVSIILNVKQKQGWNGKWPKIHFFAIYDGHGGSQCADYLKQNLHQNIFNSQNFPSDIVSAIKLGCQKTEKMFLEQALTGYSIDQSGSCALISLIVDEQLYVINIGDSRAFISLNRGKICEDMSIDHKPELFSEKYRIEQNGGQVAKNQLFGQSKIIQEQLNITIPYRVYPGGLSVSRTFGDISAKNQKLGGKCGVIIAEPEIRQKVIDSNMDFLFMGCDGLYDVQSSRELNNLLWETIESNHDFSKLPEKMIETSLIKTMENQGFDNLTAIIVGFNLLF